MRRVRINTNPEMEERMVHLGKRLTPCELLRQIYGVIDDPEMKLKLRIATSMCKSMSEEITRRVGPGWGFKSFPLNPLWTDEIINRHSDIE